MGLTLNSAKSIARVCTNKNLKHINTKELGYICPDGTINFQNAETAEKYAKNVVVRALNQKAPYEKSVIIDKNRITYEQNGTNGNCPVDLSKKGTWVHGHPDMYAKGGAYPFSSIDYNVLWGAPGLKKAVIYNSRGEMAELTKLAPKPTPKFLEKFISPAARLKTKMGRCAGGYNAALITDKAGKKELNKLSFKTLWAMLTKNPEAAKKYSEQNLNLYNKLIQESISEKGAKSVHKFWVKNAPKLDVAYSTNFSNLR